MPLAVFAGDAAKKRLGETAEFKSFQADLKPNLTSGPDATDAGLVGSTFDWF